MIDDARDARTTKEVSATHSCAVCDCCDSSPGTCGFDAESSIIVSMLDSRLCSSSYLVRDNCEVTRLGTEHGHKTGV